MARIHLILGPVGAGKSTVALGLAAEHRAVRLTLDEWMSHLFSPDRPDVAVMEWYVARSARCVDQIWRVARGILDAGGDVILELGLIQRRDRQRFFQRLDAAGDPLTIYAVDARRELRRERVEARNQARGATFSMVVPPAIFDLASDLWEPLDADERRGRDVRDLDTEALWLAAAR